MYANRILEADSYKFSQFNQYPPGTEYVYSYVASRGGEFDELVNLGWQAMLKTYFSSPITRQEIDEAEEIMVAHGEPFNRAGWDYIVNTYDGNLPVRIRALDEGTKVKPGTVMLTIVNTDPKCYWLTSFLETLILRAIWYPTTVASNSLASRKIIMAALEKTGDPGLIDFKLHDFGARGVSSGESARVGGLAHLSVFKGTDTAISMLAIKQIYGDTNVAWSVPAMEHSTVTSWGRKHEVDAYRNMVKVNGKPDGIVSAVSDSYNIYEACKMWGTELKDEVLASGATLVVRPDSGEPSEVVVKCLYILEKYFGSTVNSKGYRVLNNVRVLQGDGINHVSIRQILFCVELAGFSADNVTFGQGGGLLQMVNRDTCKFAMKCSAVGIAQADGWLEWRDVYKDPITDSGKTSLRGRFRVIKNDAGELVNVPFGTYGENVDQLRVVFDTGRIKEHALSTFAEVRARVAA